MASWCTHRPGLRICGPSAVGTTSGRVGLTDREPPGERQPAQRDVVESVGHQRSAQLLAFAVALTSHRALSGRVPVHRGRRGMASALERQSPPGSQDRTQRLLLEGEVLEEMAGQLAKPVGEPHPLRSAFLGGQAQRRQLDLAKEVGNAAVVCLEPVDRWAELGVRPPNGWEERGVLGPMVSMNELAEPQAVELELEEGSAAPECFDLLPHPVGRGSPVDRLSERLAGLEVAAEQAVHPPQLV